MMCGFLSASFQLHISLASEIISLNFDLQSLSAVQLKLQGSRFVFRRLDDVLEMEEVASLRFPPTVFQEINFISNIYTTREKLLAKLAENEYRHYRDVEIPKVECFLYTPKAFPQTREEVLGLVFVSLKDAFRRQGLTSQSIAAAV